MERRYFLLVNSVAFGTAGLLVWLLIRPLALDSPEWAICFTGGSAAVVGYLGGIIYLLNHDRSEDGK